MYANNLGAETIPQPTVTTVNTTDTTRIGALVFEDCLASSVTESLDIFRIANKVTHLRRPGDAPPYSVVATSSKGGMIRAAHGVHFETVAFDPTAFDVLIVPGLGLQYSGPSQQNFQHLGAEIDLLRVAAKAQVRLAAACTGTFLLAEAGLLDGLSATTSWWLAASFRHQYPNVNLSADDIVVDSGAVMTGGAATSFVQMCLALIAQTAGKDMADNIGRLMLVDPSRRSQAPYVNRALEQKPRHAFSESAELYLQRNLHAPISVVALAQHCKVSERTLLRRFRESFAATPLEFVQKLRVERAKALLEQTKLTFDEVVERCGYQDISSFRRLFKNVTSVTPNNYRERFRARGR